MDRDRIDTIAAISTAVGGGIAIIRISGNKAAAIAKALFKPGGGSGRCAFKSHRVYYGHIVKDGRILDECMLTFMKAPRSYTREDVAEISSHGGLKSAELILSAVLEKGAVLAEPGEFTKRAFLNGRIDLTKAQAVIDIINSKTELSHNQAINRLSGRLSADLEEIRGRLLDLLAEIEASIDYPEYDMEEQLPAQMEALESVKASIARLIKDGNMGLIMSEGLQTVILGRPNAGKSSLLNRMLGTDRAIVTEIPGTTRDVLSETVNIRGLPLNIVDTAGLRNSADIVESLGVKKSLEYAKDADLILYMLDASVDLEAEDIENISSLESKEIILIMNKVDLERKFKLSDFPSDFWDRVKNFVEISTLENIGLDRLCDMIYNLFFDNRISLENTVTVSNARDMDSLKKALAHTDAAIAAMEAGLASDLAAIDIRDAYVCLGQILGESLADDVIDRIFSKFCLGK